MATVTLRVTKETYDALVALKRIYKLKSISAVVRMILQTQRERM